jgi:hypothetical protein
VRVAALPQPGRCADRACDALRARLGDMPEVRGDRGGRSDPPLAVEPRRLRDDGVVDMGGRRSVA